MDLEKLARQTRHLMKLGYDQSAATGLAMAAQPAGGGGGGQKQNKSMKAYNQAIAMGADPNSAVNIARAKNPQQALKTFLPLMAAAQEQNASTLERRQAQENMMRQQSELMAAIAKGPPLAPRSSRRLKGGYQPKFRSAGSVAERNRNVARGTYQFSNPLGMGGGASRTGGVGGLA
mgnify:CR=1 FL=1|tara:strand:- start:221 stop:748 length:528 start_codon:yes stop_codon:yes gene_type:complete